MENPFFSVIIPTHNRSSLLKRAVESVLNQTFNNFELIVADDHSTDDTSIIAKSISDPRFRYTINQRKKGACGARNTGIFAAKGEWVAFLDDDDTWHPDKLKFQFELAENIEKTVGLICTDYAIISEKSSHPRVFRNRPSGWVKERLLFGGIGCLSSVCIRTEILRRIDGFDESFPSNQDQDLWLRVAEVAEFRYVPKALVTMYQEKRKDRIGENTKKKLDGHIMLRNKYAADIDKNYNLRHRYESNIFVYAILRNEIGLTAKCLPWVLMGFVLDFKNFLRIIKSTIILWYGTQRKNITVGNK